MGTSLLQKAKRVNNGTEEKSLGVVRDMWISLKLFLGVVIKRKSNSWDLRTFQ